MSLYLDAKQPDADIDAAQSVNKLKKQKRLDKSVLKVWEHPLLFLYLDAKQPDAGIDAAQSVNKLQKQEIGRIELIVWEHPLAVVSLS